MSRTPFVIGANFLGAFHVFLTSYILSPYLGQYISHIQVGFVFSIAAGLSMLGFIFVPAIVRAFGLKKVAITLTLMQIVALTIISIHPSVIVALIFVTLHIAIPPLISYTLDIFLEKSIKKESITGSVRGKFLAGANLALVSSPAIVGYILGDTSAYTRIFILAAMTLIPFLILLPYLSKDAAVHIKQAQRANPLWQTFKCMLHSKPIVLVTTISLVLQIFFTWMTIYPSLYLNVELGIPWSSLGWVFSIMLLPYLFLEPTLGFIADKKIGEKELMLWGTIIIALSTAGIAEITGSSVTIFMVAVLVLTRVGASMLEIATESYFFKQVSGKDVNTVSIYRSTRPFGELLGPLIGSAVLMFVNLQAAFLAFGIIVLLAVPFIALIKDTK